MIDSNTEPNNFYLVAVGASAGGLQALEIFFSHLPDHPNAAFVVVQHLSPDYRSMMAEILQRKTSMIVSTIEEGMAIEPSRVYVLPPKKHLVIKDGRLCLLESPEAFDYPIDKFFHSLVAQWREKIIAILLSGTGSDGTKGIQAVGRVGGIGLVQSPETAQFKSMPSSAIPSGLVDEILSPEELAQTVFELIRYSDNFPHSAPEEALLIDSEQLQSVLNILADREEINFSHYKISTLSRRINHRCALTHSDSLRDYINLLENSESEQKSLRRDLLIGVTQFFRDRPAWQYIESQVLPDLIAELEPEGQLRIWICACATGEEAYSMAILVDEAIAKSNKSITAKIFATDIDRDSLATTAQGIYSESIAQNISSQRLEKYFTDTGGCFRVKRFLREMLIIAPHDLTKNAGFSKMHLVSCRNVLIYMQPQLQQHVLKLLHFALANQGILFLGSSETLGDLSEEFSTMHPKWKIFSKRRDNTLALGQISHQPLVTPIPHLPRTKARADRQLDHLLSAVFKYCFHHQPLTCLLVNRNNQLLRVFYNAAQLLEFPLGEAMLEVTQIVHSRLKLPLSTALHRAKREHEPVLYTGIKIERDGEELNVSLRVASQTEDSALEDYLIVILEIEAPTIVSSPVMRFDIDEEAANQLTELEYELEQTRENLQVTIEELETTNEEQQATNEELLASNEELQSINEELQSVNEELYTVNAEHQSKILELTQLNNDIDNLLRSTDIGVIFLDHQLNLRKFTPAATLAINIKPNDIGRPIGDITNNLALLDLPAIFQQVVERQEPLEREVQIASTNEQLLMRANLYLRDNGNSDGVVVTFVKIDELKRIQSELHQANSLLENLYSTSPAGLSLHDCDLRYLRINQALADINGFSVAEHLGKTISEITPELADTVEPILHQVIATNRPVCNLQIYGSTSAAPRHKRYWNANYYPVDLPNGNRGVGSVIIDITDRIETEESLKESQANLLEAQKLAHLGNWQMAVSSANFELDRATAVWSAELFRIYGLDPQQGVPTWGKLLQLHPLEEQKIIRKAYERLLSEGVAYNLDLSLSDSQGTVRYLNSIARAVKDDDGRIISLYGAVMDITQRKQIEAELIRQNRALEEAIAVAQAADSANQAKSDFLANMSHEIRTPMNAILSVAQLLELTSINEEQQDLVRVLKSNGSRLLTLIDDILDLSKIEARELKFNEREFTLECLVQNLVDSFLPQAQARSLELITQLDPSLPTCFRGDDFRLQQVLSNLISNALKFTSAGQITIAIAPESPLTSAELTSIVVRFSIKDTGIGISEPQQEKLFQPFTQADNSTTRQYGGTGLGLTICRRIVELMGGTIGINSTVGHGSTFWFTIPLEVVSEAAVTAPQIVDDSISAPISTSTPISTAKSAREVKILVAEDYADNLDLILLMLDTHGYQTDSVNNGTEVLNRLEQQDYDLILMDCQMPVMDGYDATKAIRAREEDEKHSIIIGLTANAMSSDRQKCLNAGMDDYLSKPIDFSKLIEIIQKWS